MISANVHYGGARTVTIAADTTMQAGLGRVWIVTASSAGLRLRTPSARIMRLGGPQFMVVNAGAESFDLCDNLFGVLRTMAPGDAASVWLSSNATTQGDWHLHVGTANFIADPPSAELVYTFGGETGSGVAGTELKTREYDQQLEIWSLKTDMPVSPSYVGGSVVVVGAKAYCCGDNDAAGSNQNLEYDPDTWTARATSPTVSSFGLNTACGVRMNASAMHFNGANGAGNSGKAYEYDTAGDAWTGRATRPSNREADNVGAGVKLGIAYIAGGQGSAGTNAVDEYSIDTYTARTNRPAPFALRMATTNGDDDEIYVYGGSAGVTSSSTAFANVTRYSPSTDAWTALLNYVRGGRTKMSATSIGPNNYAVGGHPGSSLPRVQEMTEHAIATDTYAIKPNTPQFFESSNQARAVTR